MLGGLSMYVVRRATQRAVQAVAGRLEAGDVRLMVRLHVTASARDALRAAVVTAAGLALAHVVRLYFAGALPLRGVTLLGVAAVAGAIATATAGTPRVVGRGANLRWFAAGLAGGAVLVGVRWPGHRVRPSGPGRCGVSRGRAPGTTSASRGPGRRRRR